MPRQSIIQSALLWAVSAVVAGLVIVSLVASTLAPLQAHDSLIDGLKLWPFRFVVSFIFPGVIAIAALIPYCLLFGLWGLLVRRYPGLEATTLRVVGASLLLATPLVTAVLLSYLEPTGPFGPRWNETAWVTPWVVAGVWGGILMPRLAIPRLRAKASPFAV